MASSTGAPDDRGSDTHPLDIVAKIQLIGSIRVVDHLEVDILPAGRRPRAILAITAMSLGDKVSRNTLIDLLWGRSSEREARQSLRTALSTLKSSLNRHGFDVVDSDNDHVWISAERSRIDVAELLGGGRPLDGGILLRAGKGELMKELFGTTPELDQWLHAERNRFEDRLVQLLTADLSRIKETGGGPELRAAAARRLTEIEPTNEAATRELMQAHWDLGDRTAAIRAFERCRDALKQMLDTTPSRQTSALFEALKVVRTSVEDLPANASENSSRDIFRRPRSIGTADGPPSVAVLPLVTLSEDPSVVLVAEGIVEDIIEILSRLPTFFVISRLSTRAFAGTSMHPQEIGRKLGVRYILSGSLRASADRWRLFVELCDAHLGLILWNARFDELSTDAFDLQDQISLKVARSLSPSLHAAEIKRIRVKRPENLHAYDLLLRGIDQMHNKSRDAYERAGENFIAAAAQDPEFAAAHAWCAYWHALRVGQGWSTDKARDTTAADHYARLAVACDPADPMALAMQGHLTAYLHKDFDRAFRRLELATTINPNSTFGWGWRGLANGWAGDGRLGIEQVDRAIALTPCDPLLYTYFGNAGVVSLVAGEYDRAIEFSNRCLEENATYTSAHRMITIAHALAGRPEQARHAANRLLSLETGLTVAGFRERYPGSGSAHCNDWCNALRQAGVPNG
ncbi:MAG: hypothetical protein JNK67_27525 [Alphaproteobacteria bacterium]|nr:hypothetical protein [Alphaproteobacteria bacterium]